MIKVDEGKIYDIVWDNQCNTCKSSNLCYKEANITSVFNTSITNNYENCKLDIAECNSNKDSCEPKFYITWFGTDKNKRQFKSANLAMSKFKKYSISSLYKSLKNLFNK